MPKLGWTEFDNCNRCRIQVKNLISPMHSKSFMKTSITHLDSFIFFLRMADWVIKILLIHLTNIYFSRKTFYLCIFSNYKSKMIVKFIWVCKYTYALLSKTILAVPVKRSSQKYYSIYLIGHYIPQMVGNRSLIRQALIVLFYKMHEVKLSFRERFSIFWDKNCIPTSYREAWKAACRVKGDTKVS